MSTQPKKPVTKPAAKPTTKPDREPVLAREPDKGVGKAAGDNSHPANLRVPESVLIKAPVLNEQGEIVTSPTVRGNKAMIIMDVVNNCMVHVSLIEGVALVPDVDGRLIYVEGNVSNDLMTVGKANKFAVKKDGTIIYDQRGFSGVPPGHDMVDIVKLIEHNHSSAGIAADKKLKAEVEADSKKATKAADHPPTAAEKKATEAADKKAAAEKEKAERDLADK